MSIKYKSKDGKVRIECDAENTRLLDHMRDELMATLYKEWREFIEEVRRHPAEKQAGRQDHPLQQTD